MFFIENKVRAPISHEQVKKYLEIRDAYLERHATSQVFIMFLTMWKIPEWFNVISRREKLLHFYWSEINDCLRTFLVKEGEAKSKCYLSSFLEFMESKGMKSFSGFKSKNYAENWSNYAEFRDNAKLVLDQLKEAMSHKGLICHPKESPQEEDYIGYSFIRRIGNGDSITLLVSSSQKMMKTKNNIFGLILSCICEKPFAKRCGRNILQSRPMLPRS